MLAAVVLVVAGLGTWIGLSGGSGAHSGTASHKPVPSALMKALILANKSSEAGGMLPPSACKQNTPTHVTCTAPATGITAAVFQTYPSLKALYAAYTAKVSSLNSGQFKQNFSDCGSQATFGEVGWNHLFQHPKKYTVDQMTMGTGEGRPGRGPGVLQLHPGPGVHGVDPERRQHAGLRVRTGARRTCGTGGCPYTTTSAWGPVRSLVGS